MGNNIGRVVLVGVVLVILGSVEIKAETGSTGYISNPSSTSDSTTSTSSNVSSAASTSNNTTASTSNATNTSNSSTNSTTSTSAKPAALAATSNAVAAASTTTAASSGGISTNVQSASVQVEPFSGSAGLSIPIAVPPGRAGIQPNLALEYSSSNRQLGNAGVGWNLDLGSIQISSKKGVPKYDGTDIFTMEQAGATQDLVADPSTSGLYHMEVEGAFARIQYFTTYWVITDKKGIKYYYGNYGTATGCIQNDPANPTHIFRWALSRVEDLNGNYMTFSYLADQGQIYPQTISYTGNDQSSLILSTYAQVSISYVAATSPSLSYISKFLVKTAQRIDHISVYANSNIQSTYTFTYATSADTGRDLLKSVTQVGSDGVSALPPVTFTYSSITNNGSIAFSQASGWSIPSGLQFATQGVDGSGNPAYITNGVEAVDINGDGYPDLIKFNASDCGNGPDPTNGVYLNNHQNAWVLSPSYPWPAGVFLADQCSNSKASGVYPPQYSIYKIYNTDDFGVRLIDVDGDGRPDIVQAFSQVDKLTPSNISSLGSSELNTLIQNGMVDVYNYIIVSSFPIGLSSSVESILDSDLNTSCIQTSKGCSTTYSLANSSQFNLYLNQSSQFLSQSLSIPNNPVFSTESIIQSNYFPPRNTLGAPPSSFTDTLTTTLGNTAFADVNGDGFPDIVTINPPSNLPCIICVSTSSHVYINQKGQNPSQLGWQEQLPTTLPNVGNFSEGTMMIDLTGDGLSDMIQISASQGSWVYMNTGNGWVQDTSSPWLQGINTTNCDFAVGNGTFVDLNGDGLPDLICTGGGATNIYFNTGHGWSAGVSATLPGLNLTNASIQFLDANANGLMDYMVYGSATPQLYLNPGTAPSDLLIGINNGIGAQTNITYDSALHYPNTYMPYYIPVVKSTTTTVDSQSYTTNYNYAGGLWDTNYREFDGFSTVKVIDPNGNYVTSTFLQDHWLKGHPSEQDTYDSNGNLYSKTVNTWQAQTIATNTTSNQISKFLYVSRTDNYLYDGNSSAIPKRTAQEFTYGENPQYGDATQVINDGQVDPAAGTSIDANKTVSQVTYINNTSNWLLGLPAQTITQDTNGNTISKTSFYYDGDTTGSATPSLGHLTSKINWLGSTTQADPKTTYTYDGYGNLQTTADPLGNTTTIVYDSAVHMFPIQTSNALKQVITMTYFGLPGGDTAGRFLGAK